MRQTKAQLLEEIEHQKQHIAGLSRIRPELGHTHAMLFMFAVCMDEAADSIKRFHFIRAYKDLRRWSKMQKAACSDGLESLVRCGFQVRGGLR